MEILHRVRHRSGRLSSEFHMCRDRPRSTGPFLCLPLAVAIGVGACGPASPELVPDAYLQSELGLDSDDRVHTIVLTGGVGELAEPGSVSVLPGDFVQFVTDDWLIHEIGFQEDSLSTAAAAFLEETAQMASPPLLQKGSRFVLSFADAPPGRYSYTLEGNAGPGGGVIVVLGPQGR